jgi:uncharacterized protein (UPF0333 family)
MYKKQSGFALVEGLLIILILAIIGFGGYYVWHTQQQTNKTLDTAATTSQKAASATAPNTSSKKYLTTKEWSVRLPYAGSDIYTYSYESTTPDVIEVISGNLAKQYGCVEFGAGQIGRFKPTDQYGPSIDAPTVQEYEKQNPGTFAIVGGYYYGFNHDQAACSESVPVDAQNAANTAVSKIYKDIQAIPQ